MAAALPARRGRGSDRTFGLVGAAAQTNAEAAGGGEISEKRAGSIKYQVTSARLPLAKVIGAFDFDTTTVNERWSANSPAEASRSSRETWC